jgi:hypothetical protein
MPHPTVDESLNRLSRAGWSVGHVAALGLLGLTWCVSGTNRENALEARGRSLAEAYRRACCLARELGMLAAPPRPGGRNAAH